MPWGQEQWGEGQWGEELPINIGDFVDQGGNALALPASADFFGYTAPDPSTVGRNEFYELHLQSMREIDERQGAFLWKRFCEGPEQIRKLLNSKVDELDTLINVTTIADEFVRLKLPQAGWTKQFNSITDKLSNEQVRALLVSSARLWKNRGAAGSFIEALNLIVGVGVWEWDWFDQRFVLGKARLGQDEAPSNWTDARFTNTASRYTSELRVADPDRTLDRQLIADVLKVWRPAGERIRVVFLEFWDRFADDSRPWVLYESQGLAIAPPAISSGTLQLTNTAIEEHAFPESSALLQLENYMVKARIRSPETSGYYGISLGFAGTFAISTELRLYPDLDELRIYQNAVNLFTFDLLHDFGINLVANAWHTLRVIADVQRVVIYVDNVKVLEGDAMGILNSGTSGLVHGVDSTLECDHFEIIPIPGELIHIEINS